MSHHCHATNCSVPVPPEMFMCRRHWFMVSKPQRDAIWDSYRAGQCDDHQPSRRYLVIAKLAVISVARREGYEPDTRIYDMFLGAK